MLISNQTKNKEMQFQCQRIMDLSSCLLRHGKENRGLMLTLLMIEQYLEETRPSSTFVVDQLRN